MRLASGVNVELTATARTGSGRFTYPANRPATMPIRASDRPSGQQRRPYQSGWPLAHDLRLRDQRQFLPAISTRSAAAAITRCTLLRVDQPFTTVGTWENDALKPGTTTAAGGTTYGTNGYPVAGKGSGAYVGFDIAAQQTVHVRVGISYVSEANARANLKEKLQTVV